jgi:hypothetical protein
MQAFSNCEPGRIQTLSRIRTVKRGNFSAAAGFGFDHGRTGVFSTFSAFLEMCLSEITMARLNFCNVLCHFSHAGVDEIADNSEFVHRATYDEPGC